MSQTQKVRRFRANPVEVAIFSIISLVFVNSVYSLFYENQNLLSSPFLATQSAGTSTAPLRLPASIQGPERGSEAATENAGDLIDLNFKCESKLAQKTTAKNLRLSGLLCGMSNTSTAGRLVKATIENKTNGFQATVFTDMYHGHFSTDYIRLEDGENLIKVEFKYFDGNSVVSELTLEKVAPLQP